MALSDTNPTTRERWLGSYRLLNELGRGANGVVYLADRGGQRVALKVLLPTGVDDPEAVVRFQLEAEVARKLDDPGVVGVYDAGREGNHYYFAMEYCEGPTLRKRLKLGKPYEPVDACKLMAQLARTVAHAHAQGVLHRDLKPANIILDQHQGGRPRITDFGLARDRSLLRSLTETGTIMGTPLYMSPEQLRGDKDVDGRADVYSLGVILYQCLTGETPHSAENRIELTKQVLYEDAPPPSRRVSGLPPWLDDVCLRALAKDREARSTAAELLEDLEAGLRLGESRGRSSRASRASRAGPRSARVVRHADRRARMVQASAGLIAVGLLGAGAIVLSSGEPPSTGQAPPTSASEAPPATPVIEPAALTPELEATLAEARAMLSVPTCAIWYQQVERAHAQAGSDPGLRAAVDEEVQRMVRALFAACESNLHARAPYDASLSEALGLAADAALPPLRGQVRWEQADYLRRRALYPQSRQVADKLAEQDSDWRARALRLKAHAVYKAEGLTAAWPRWREAWLSDREGAAGLTALAERDLACRRPEEALAYAQRALRLAPDSAAALCLVAATSQRLGYQPVDLEVRDDPELLLLAHRSKGEVAFLDAALELTEDRDADVLMAFAESQLANQDRRALATLDLAFAARPDAQSLVLKGVLLWNNQRRDEAEPTLARALAADPDHFLVALEELDLRDPRQMDKMREAVGLSHTTLWDQRSPVAPAPAGVRQLESWVAAVSPPARPALAAALQATSEGLVPWDPLVAELVRAEQAAPDDAVLLERLATLYLGRDATAEALRLIARARELGGSGSLDLLEAEALLRAGRNTEADTLYARLASRAEPSVAKWVAAAELRLLNEQPEEAAQAAREALALDPTQRSALAVAIRSQSKTSTREAQRLAREAIDLYGSLDSRLLYARASADGAFYVTPEGVNAMMSNLNHRRGFRSATRYAKAGVWTSVGGSHTCLVLLRDTMALILTPELQSMFLLAFFYRNAKALVAIGKKRDPECAELYEAEGAIAWETDEERDEAWAVAKRLGGGEIDPPYVRVAQMVAQMAPSFRLMKDR